LWKLVTYVVVDGKLFHMLTIRAKKWFLLHRVSKKLCKIVFVRTSSNFHKFW